MIRAPLRLKLQISVRGVGRVLLRPLGVLTTLGVAFLVVTFFVWLPNIGLLYELGKLPTLSYWDKVQVFFEGLGGLMTNNFELQAISILLVSLLVGLNTAMLVVVGSNIVGHAKSGGATLLAVFAAGCAACGTSIFAPVLASLVAVTSAGLVEVFGLIANLIAICLLAFSIYRLGMQAASIQN